MGRRKKKKRGGGANRPRSKRGGANKPSGRGERARKDRPTSPPAGDALPGVAPQPSPDEHAAPALLTPEEIRQRLGLDPAEYSDEQLQQAYSVDHQYRGLPALLMTMHQIDTTTDAGLLGHYMARAETDQRHEHELMKGEQKIIKVAILVGLAIMLVIVLTGIAAAAFVPEAAGEIMTGVAAVAALLAAPRLIEAVKGQPSPEPPPSESD